MRRAPRFCEVVLPLPLSSTFHYDVPVSFRKAVALGQRVWVSFGSREMLGFVVGFPKKPDVGKLKPILGLIDSEPVLSPELLALTRWMARTYCAGWGEAIEAALPGPFRRGLLRVPSSDSVSDPPSVPNAPHVLTREQEVTLAPILESVTSRRHDVFLLHGITGSGKTEVYLQAIERVLERGRSAIVLVPEISLTPQTIERFEGRFSRERIALLHSGLSEGRRLAEWHRIRSQKAQVVVGARSAVFAPVASLGMIVIDEEHETSYKQEDVPRYHAREVAIERARLAGAPVILGSATPSLESYFRACSGRFRLLSLRERIKEQSLPGVEVVDMRREWESGRRNRVFSRRLEEELQKTLEARAQAILFLNRRGFSTHVHCTSCGHVVSCQACQIPLTYHISDKTLICHYCRRSQKPPEVCLQCRLEYVRFRGTGTERVESELARLFPQARCGRMDTDALKARGSHAQVLERFKKHDLDVLIGTQMLAKGLDFPKVTLVGVISADTALRVPDFRSAERTFHLLTQVAGRAGRGKLSGKVIIQTYTPHHNAIQCASRHDYEGFYKKEMDVRKQLRLPPFSRLVELTLRSMRDGKAMEAAQELARRLSKILPKKVDMLGPAPAPLPRLRRFYRWHILLKLPLGEIPESLSTVLRRQHLPHGTYCAVDVDPL